MVEKKISVQTPPTVSRGLDGLSSVCSRLELRLNSAHALRLNSAHELRPNSAKTCSCARGGGLRRLCPLSFWLAGVGHLWTSPDARNWHGDLRSAVSVRSETGAERRARCALRLPKSWQS